MKRSQFIEDIKTKYSGEGKKILEVSCYMNNKSTALRITALDGEPLIIATVNLEKYAPPDGHILIKDWSENEGIQLALEKAGLISEPINHYPTGFVEATEHRMKGKLLEAWEAFKEEQGGRLR